MCQFLWLLFLDPKTNGLNPIEYCPTVWSYSSGSKALHEYSGWYQYNNQPDRLHVWAGITYLYPTWGRCPRKCSVEFCQFSSSQGQSVVHICRKVCPTVKERVPTVLRFTGAFCCWCVSGKSLDILVRNLVWKSFFLHKIWKLQGLGQDICPGYKWHHCRRNLRVLRTQQFTSFVVENTRNMASVSFCSKTVYCQFFSQIFLTYSNVHLPTMVLSSL